LHEPPTIKVREENHTWVSSTESFVNHRLVGLCDPTLGTASRAALGDAVPNRAKKNSFALKAIRSLPENTLSREV
jgi:hypothetical protein